jgi:hypothetical protein
MKNKTLIILAAIGAILYYAFSKGLIGNKLVTSSSPHTQMAQVIPTTKVVANNNSAQSLTTLVNAGMGLFTGLLDYYTNDSESDYSTGYDFSDVINYMS